MADDTLVHFPPNGTEKPPADLIPAAVVLSEAGNRLKMIRRHADAIHSFCSQLDEGNEYATALTFAIQALKAELKDLADYLGRMVCSQTGEALGIEKGGER